MRPKREQFKELAIYAMEKMKLSNHNIRAFQESDEVLLYVNGLGYSIDECDDDVEDIITRIEAKRDKMVYAVCKNIDDGDTVYALLIVRAEDEEDTIAEEYTIDGISAFKVFCYCYNADYNEDSKYQYITVQNLYGGIRRIANGPNKL